MTAPNRAIENYACPHCRAVFRTAFQRCPLDGNPLEPLVGDPLAGSSFADRYIIEECVGEGGMGRVYRARHQRMSRLFAVKVLFGDHAADTKMQARLAREAESASRLSHPNVISVLDFGETKEGLLYLVMDYVDGPTLAQLIEQAAPMDRERVIKLVRDMARGLSHAHKRNLIHRDFKADNVIVATDGNEETAKIVDFGIAVLNEPTKERKLTTEGMVLGTPAVMAPEQAVGDEVDHRTDLFSLGVVMYEMLCGKLPFDGSPLEIARQNLATEAPRITQRVPGLWVDQGLEDLSHALMSKNANDRPATAKVVLQALAQIEGESSREFLRTEGVFRQDAGLDPMTPLPVMAPAYSVPPGAPTAADYVDPPSSPGHFAPHSDLEHSREFSRPGFSAPSISTMGVTEAVAAQHRRTKRARLFVPIALIVVLGAIGFVAAMAFSRGAGQEETKTAANDAPKGQAALPDASAIAVVDSERLDGGGEEESANSNDDEKAGDDEGELVQVDPDPVLDNALDKKRERDSRAKEAAKKKQREEAKKKARDAKRAEEAKERAKKAELDRQGAKTSEDDENAKEKAAQKKFEAYYNRVSRLVQRASKLDKKAAGVARSFHKGVSLGKALRNKGLRADARAALKKAERAANRVIKAHAKKSE